MPHLIGHRILSGESDLQAMSWSVNRNKCPLYTIKPNTWLVFLCVQLKEAWLLHLCVTGNHNTNRMSAMRNVHKVCENNMTKAMCSAWQKMINIGCESANFTFHTISESAKNIIRLLLGQVLISAFWSCCFWAGRLDRREIIQTSITISDKSILEQ